MKYSLINASVELGDGVAVIRRDSASQPIVANVLEAVKDEAGLVKTVWLDRVVHQTSDRFDGWEASGAFVTELHRMEGKQ